MIHVARPGSSSPVSQKSTLSPRRWRRPMRSSSSNSEPGRSGLCPLAASEISQRGNPDQGAFGNSMRSQSPCTQDRMFLLLGIAAPPLLGVSLGVFFGSSRTNAAVAHGNTQDFQGILVHLRVKIRQS